MTKLLGSGEGVLLAMLQLFRRSLFYGSASYWLTIIL
jgi:hypothetical protein